MKKFILIGLLLTQRAYAESCFIDGAFVIRCGETVGGSAYEGVSWPVFTSDSPRGVIDEMNKRRTEFVTPYRDSYGDIVQHVKIGTGENYPDIICLKFKKGSEICFDTMEITER